MTHLAWPEGYNAAWNELRLKYQGIKPPVERSEASFDPGAKYHIPATTPYLRYFLANVLQFQFYKAACEQSGWKGPLHRCSFYDNKAVGKKFNTILEMGASRPWPDALEAFIGQREISGEAIIVYFAPLQAWLKEAEPRQKLRLVSQRDQVKGRLRDSNLVRELSETTVRSCIEKVFSV